ncbi:MAG TPA: DNA-3-methyladenine glycosylase [Bacteroidia bacterium]|jgi:DNA-3-methyladenine glycosylase|nr:DNA-3-methyladenine glycosylase [Bacteroidia bacterium]
MKLERDFYRREDVVRISKELLGKSLFTRIGGKTTSGIIIETEAYAGVNDKASHAFGGRRTARTETMFGNGGFAYVYLCYGIHHLFNVVTNSAEVPHAVLIRAILPEKGLSTMLERRHKEKLVPSLCAGPGTVSEALGIKVSHTGTDLTGKTIWIEDRGLKIPNQSIVAGPRVGVDYAGKDALLPYRFRAKIR